MRTSGTRSSRSSASDIASSSWVDSTTKTSSRYRAASHSFLSSATAPERVVRLTPSIVCAQDESVGIFVEEWRGSEEFEQYEQEIEIANMDPEDFTPPESIAASQVGSPCY